MESILETLYSLVEPIQESPQERKALLVSRMALERACPHLTESELDAVWGAAMSAYAAGQKESFCHGFRVGMRTAIEGLQDVN